MNETKLIPVFSERVADGHITDLVADPIEISINNQQLYAFCKEHTVGDILRYAISKSDIGEVACLLNSEFRLHNIKKGHQTKGEVDGLVKWLHDNAADERDIDHGGTISAADNLDRSATLLSLQEAELAELRRQIASMRPRLDLLQQEKHRFREPERTILCDILAYNQLLPDPDGWRYGVRSTSTEPATSTLQWSKNKPPCEECKYDHCEAETPFGIFLISWEGWKEGDRPTVDETPWGKPYRSFATLELAKAACQRGFDARLALCGYNRFPAEGEALPLDGGYEYGSMGSGHGLRPEYLQPTEGVGVNPS